MVTETNGISFLSSKIFQCIDVLIYHTNVPMYFINRPSSTNCSLTTDVAILLLKNHMISKLELLVPQENITSEPSDTFCDLGTTVSSPEEFSDITGFSRQRYKTIRLIRYKYSMLFLLLIFFS